MLICLMIQKRFEGTRVTIETFLAWKAKFDSELAELRRQKGKDDSSNKKMTGTYCYRYSDIYFRLLPTDEWHCDHVAWLYNLGINNYVHCVKQNIEIVIL